MNKDLKEIQHMFALINCIVIVHFYGTYYVEYSHFGATLPG
jgi:hypothetical protein